MKYGVIVHGGAGDDILDREVEAFMKGVRKACEKAYEILEKGGKALEAVEEAICLMEDNPAYDAGKGSFVNERGEIEMDAIIATDDFKIGSVCGIQHVKNPIKIARLVMEKTKHVILAGEGATTFARKQGLECSQEELLTHKERERYANFTSGKGISNVLKEERAEDKRWGTVGCICLDKNGEFAVGGSTGGSALKMKGRIGDTSIWGSGAYVEKIGGAVTTGEGEKFIKIMASKQAVDYLSDGKSAQEAANKTIKLVKEEVKGRGGIIILTKDGVGLAFNTKRMAHAYKTDSMKKMEVKIERTEKD